VSNTPFVKQLGSGGYLGAIGGQSESTLATSAHEAAFRSRYANSRPRTASLIALDDASDAIVEASVAALPERRRQVRLPMPVGENWMAAIEGQARALLDDAQRSDIMVMIATAGSDAQSGALLGEACRLRGIPVTALIIAEPGTGDDALSRTLGCLRPIASMVVVATGPDYVEDMLLALRA